MIKMSVSQQNQINGRKVPEFQTGAPDAFQQEEPVGEIGINQDVQIRELGQKRRMANPGQGHLSGSKLGEFGPDMLAVRGVNSVFQTSS